MSCRVRSSIGTRRNKATVSLRNKAAAPEKLVTGKTVCKTWRLEIDFCDFVPRGDVHPLPLPFPVCAPARGASFPPTSVPAPEQACLPDIVHASIVGRERFISWGPFSSKARSDDVPEHPQRPFAIDNPRPTWPAVSLWFSDPHSDLRWQTRFYLGAVARNQRCGFATANPL